MSIKRKIKYKGASLFINEDEEYCEELAKTFKGEKIKKPIEKKKEELHERDRPRYDIIQSSL